MSASSSLKIQSSGDIAYRDYQIGSCLPSVSRSRIDLTAYHTRGPLALPVPTTVLPLSELCMRVFAQYWNEPGALDKLDAAHRLLAPQLLELVKKYSDGIIPWEVFFRFNSKFGFDVPKKFRLYHGGLVLSDTSELKRIETWNQEASFAWQSEVSLDAANREYRKRKGQLPKEISSPAFFLAALDLSNDQSFTDQSIYKLLPLAAFLAVLKLDHTQVTDAGILFITAAAGKEQHYDRLEYLSLRGLRSVSDLDANRIAQLPALRMLDLRGTRSTTGFRTKLNSLSEIPWIVAHDRGNRSRELELFGDLHSPSYSPSEILTFLRESAVEEQADSPYQIVEMPIVISLKAVHRGILSTHSDLGKTAEERYADQIALTARQNTTAYTSVYGSVASTLKISRGSLEEDAEVEKSVGSAFRNRGDAIASGSLLLQGRSEHIRRREASWSVDQRQMSIVNGYSDDSEDLENSEDADDSEELEEVEDNSEELEEVEDSEGWTDGGSDNDEENAEQEQAILRLQHEQAQAQLLPFFRQPFKNTYLSKYRQLPQGSELMLLRHLPLRSPCDPIQMKDTDSSQHSLKFDDAAPLKRKQEGTSSTTPYKRARPPMPAGYSPITSSQVSHDSASSWNSTTTPDHRTSPSLPSESRSKSPFDTTGAHPFGPKVVTKPLLARSSLSAFRKKRM